MHGIFLEDDKTRKEFLDILKLEKKFWWNITMI
jgi:hypothetical protein